MSRLNKIVSISILVLFILACNFVTEPIRDVQNVAGTAQSFASYLTVETLQAHASQCLISEIFLILKARPWKCGGIFRL
jgi:hypothetical protein